MRDLGYCMLSDGQAARPIVLSEHVEYLYITALAKRYAVLTAHSGSYYIARMHVLIVGAGFGGLTLAQTLRKQGITFEIFERDPSKDSRFQGWAIALHMYVI
jgi:ribulose 1,5-bisphosphate synthetase/thiazole synthase